MKLFSLSIILLLSLSAHLAAEESRTWTSTAGSTLEGRLISSSATEVTLEKNDGGQLTLKLNQLVADDQAFVREQAKLANRGETSVDGLEAEPGRISGEIQCQADSEWSYYLYLPKDFHTGEKWPVCFVMDPGGGHGGTLDRYTAAAERFGVILAASKQSKNEFDRPEDAVLAITKDVYDRVPIAEELSFASGFSGGSRMAYRLAELEDNIAGIVACGSGAGVYPQGANFRSADVPRGVIVCSLMGANCFNRSEAISSQERLPRNSRLIWFPGNHDWANSDEIEEGLAHVYGWTLAQNQDRETAPRREEFAQTLLSYAREHQEDAPWRALRWARFLTEELPSSLEKEASALVSTLENEARAQRGLEAAEAMNEFAEEYFHSGDHTAEPASHRAASDLAEEFAGLPQADTIKRMGEPSPAP
jgi:hypothetical protein